MQYVNWRFFKSKSSDFLKLNYKTFQVYVALMNAFDKRFVLAFYNFFLNIELNCDKENYVVTGLEPTTT